MRGLEKTDEIKQITHFCDLNFALFGKSAMYLEKKEVKIPEGSM